MIDCIHRLNDGRVIGGYPSEETMDRIGLLRFAWRNCIFMLWLVYGRNWLANGCMGQKEWMGGGWYRGGMEEPTLAVTKGVPPLYLEVRWATGSGGCHQLRWCCKGAYYLCQRRKII